MKVQILRAGVYLDEALKAKTCRAGAELETKEAYGLSLVKDGLAAVIPEVAPKAKRGGRSKKSGEQPARRGGSGGNPFLG